jgi:hypothetical protein
MRGEGHGQVAHRGHDGLQASGLVHDGLEMGETGIVRGAFLEHEVGQPADDAAGLRSWWATAEESWPAFHALVFGAVFFAQDVPFPFVAG